jgi:uncharacterized phosphosugar-binding protein
MQRFFIIFLLVTLIFSGFSATASPAQNKPQSYIERLEQRTEQWQTVLPEIQKSSSEAAEKIIAGGNLYAIGPQGGFQVETYIRAGGLMLIQPYTEATVLGNKDVILAASADETLPDTFLTLVKKADAAGCKIILFSSSLHGSLPDNNCMTVLPNKKFTEGPSISPISIEYISNVIGMWTWTAEFTSACVKKGQMPCFFESYGLPGGAERTTMINQTRFHAYSDVTPADVENLGLRYLQSVEDSLQNIREHDVQAFQKAASFIRTSHASGHNVRLFYDAHMFPWETKVKQNPDWIIVNPSNQQQLSPGEKLSPGDTVIIIDYQAFPGVLCATLASQDTYCILTCSHQPPAEFTRNPKNVYIDPFWTMTDAAVPVNHYDIKILPVSGIMQSAVYWQLIELSKLSFF